MTKDKLFFRNVCYLAVPVALQSMLQSSFSVVDQIMIGQLGSIHIAGVGLAGKFSSIFSVVVAAFGTAAGIMISQYLGQKNKGEVQRSFYINLWFSVLVAGIFTLACALFPGRIMGVYTLDPDTRNAAAGYLRIVSGTFFPMAGATMLATLFRCMEKASYPLYASICAALANTGLNYILIFGKFGFSPMGAEGAAIATVISQYVNLALMLILYRKNGRELYLTVSYGAKSRFRWMQYGAILLPMLACEFLWSLGENVYAAIYGHLGTQASAAMTLTNPIQSLMIGALCGLSQAAAVIVGKLLGNGETEKAYGASKKLMAYGFAGSVVLSLMILGTSSIYVQIYQVDDSVKQLTRQILAAYAAVAPFKIQNMILGGGIVRSGGKTKYIMAVDMIGTWLFGVPLGMLSAFVFHLPVSWVYFILSLEECVRFAITLVIFRGRKWMNQLQSNEETHKDQQN